MLREQYERGAEGVRKFQLDQDIPNGAAAVADESLPIPADAAEDGNKLSVNEEAMLIAQMQAIQAMQVGIGFLLGCYRMVVMMMICGCGCSGVDTVARSRLLCLPDQPQMRQHQFSGDAKTA